MDIDSIEEYRGRIVEGPLLSTIVWLGLPIMIVNIVNVSYSIADAYWLSKYSDIVLSVPQQVWPTLMLFHSLSMALSVANQALMSQYIGAKKYREASLVASKYFTVSFTLGLLFSITYFLLRPFIFSYVVSTPKEIYGDVLLYSSVSAIGLFFTYLGMVYVVVLQSIGDTRTPAIVNGLSSILNIVLDPFLILGLYGFPRLGVLGAAIATLLSRFIVVPILAYIVKRRFTGLRIWFTRDIDSKWVLKNIRIGAPILVLVLSSSTAFMMLVKLVNLFGIVVVTAYSIGFIILNLADASLRGFTQAVSIMVGQCIGAGREARAKEIAWKTEALVFSSILVASTTLYFLKRPFIEVFTSDNDIVYEADKFLSLFLWSIPFFGLFMVGMSIGRGSGHTGTPMFIGILRLWIIRIGGGYILALIAGLGSYGIWTAMTLSNIVAGLVMMLWVHSWRWIKPVID